MVVVLSAAVGFKSRDRGFDWSKSKWFSIDRDERYFSSRNYSLSLSLSLSLIIIIYLKTNFVPLCSFFTQVSLNFNFFYFKLIFLYTNIKNRF
jgi:hypothetical protein